jgi:hypothetical protein
MKLSKNFCWNTLQKAVKRKKRCFCTDGWKYDIVYTNDGYRITNKSRVYQIDIVTKQDEHNSILPDGTPLYFTDGSYKPLPIKGNK